MAEAEEDIKEYLLKVLVVGDSGVGKTSVIQRYVHNVFDREYKATIGVDFAYKQVPLSENKEVRLQLWDISGEERYGTMSRVYYKDAVGAIVVFDLTRPKTLESVKRWKNDIDTKVNLKDANETPIPVILLGNQCDMARNALDPSKLDVYCKETGFIRYFETSAKDGTNVEESIKFLVEKIVEVQAQLHLLEKDDESGIDVDVSDREMKSESKKKKKENSCC